MSEESDLVQTPGEASERYAPTMHGRIRFEHFHRYALAREFVAGKTVLDIACGEGYGSALLAERANHVIGADIDAPTVTTAAAIYADKANISFRVGSCDAMPLENNAVDVIVSFETIEHHLQHEAMMREIKRVLRPDGLLILSSPNRRVYSDEAQYRNPYHVRELYRDELASLLRRHFAYMQLYGQTATLGSFVFRMDDVAEGQEEVGNAPHCPSALPLLIQNRAERIGYRAGDDDIPYFLALCADNAASLPAFDTSAYVAPADASLKVQENALQWCEEELKRHKEYLPQLEDKYRVLEMEWLDWEDKARREIEQRDRVINAWRERCEKAESALLEIESRFAYRAAARVHLLPRRGGR